jgi:hypothetical protein
MSAVLPQSIDVPVTVCGAGSSLMKVTVSPGCTRATAGPKQFFTIETVVVEPSVSAELEWSRRLRPARPAKSRLRTRTRRRRQ